MKKHGMYLVAALSAIAFGVLSAGATEWFVNCEQLDDSGDGKSEANAKQTIQAAVDAASAGDVVTVLPGVYDTGGKPFTSGSVVSSNRVYITKNLTLRSRDGAETTHIVGAMDTSVATNASPWGMGTAAVRCIAVANGLTSVSIEGFTIRNGTSAFGTDTVPVRGGGVLNMRTNPGADYVEYIVVSNCVIRDNTATRGGGTYGIRAIDCTYTGNRASDFGIAARQCSMKGCLLYRNRTLGSASVGVLAYGYRIDNCTIAYHETANVFSSFDSVTTACVSNTIAVANYGCGIAESKIHASITDAGKKANGCTNVSSTAQLFVAPAAGDFRLRAESEAVTNNPAVGVAYCGAVQEAVSCEGSGYLSFTPASGGTMYVDGIPVGSSVYAYASPWPRVYSVTFAPNDGKGLACYKYGGLCRWPTADEIYYVIPPVSGGASVAAVVGVMGYVSPDGDDSADGTADAPWQTLQGAMDALTGDALVSVAPGIYATGGAVSMGTSNRLVCASGRCVRFKAQEGPSSTFIVGAEDPAPTVANDYGLGPNATRCVCFSGSGSSVQGFTLTGGRTSLNANYSDGDSVRGGAAISYLSGNANVNSALLDCVISNNVASRGAVIFGGTVERCLLAENVVPYGNSITRTGTVRSSVYTRNVSPNNTVGMHSLVRNCTVVSNCCPNDQLSGDGGASNTVFAANSTANDIGKRTGVGCTVYEKCATGVTLVDCVQDTTLFADYLNDDFRPYASSAGSFFGSPAAFADGGCFADFYGNPFPISEDGRITAGAVSELIPSVKVVSPVPGGTDVEGVVTEFPVTVTATCSDRQLLGFLVNGATQSVEGASVTLTEEQVAGFTAFTVQPVYNTDWWVDAENGNDANTGWTSESAKKTLAAAMSLAWAGDTVHALPGVYDSGTMVQDDPYLTSATTAYTDVVIPARVVVQTNVMLVAEGGVDETVIEGGADSSGDYGLGLGAVRCVYLNNYSTVKGFTIRGARTDTTNEQDDNNRGGGVKGRAWNLCVAEDCIITNCRSYRAAAAFNATLVRCRMLDNFSSGNSPVGRELALYGCYADGNVGHFAGRYTGVVQDHYDVIGCTFTANNGYGEPSNMQGPTRVSVGQGKGRKFWNNVVAMSSNDDGNAQVISNAYGNVFLSSLHIDVLQGDDNLVVDAEQIALGSDGIPLHGSVAIDSGSFDYAATNLTGETGLNGVRRGLGGGVDRGAFEFDWLPRFAQDMGGKSLSVTDADNAIFENGDGLVELPSGTLYATWAPGGTSSMSCPCSFSVAVTGTGTLTVTKNGAVLGTYTQGSYDVEFFGSGSMDFEFSYEPGTDDEGGAVLSNFFASIGTVIILR